MRVLSSEVEVIGKDRIRVVSVIDISELDIGHTARELAIGKGPIGTAIPDKIVKYLIERAPHSIPISEIQAAVGGNPATVNRQAWTLANNAPDLQLRLRGWVVGEGRGRYALSIEAINQIPALKEFHTHL